MIDHVGARHDAPNSTIIRCACDSGNCPAQLDLIPEGKFIRVKSGGVTVAVDVSRAAEIIAAFLNHFGVDVLHHATDLVMHQKGFDIEQPKTEDE